MDSSMIKGLVMGAVVATAGGAIASYTLFGDKEKEAVPEAIAEVDKGPEFAQVVNVEEVRQTVNTPREVCEDVPVTRKKEPTDKYKIAGTAGGAVLGGLAGSLIGGGKGKTLATVAGAAAGGYAGNKVQGNMQDNNTYTTTERRCNTVMDSHQKVVGYNVTYTIGDQKSTVHMDKKPGNRIPVENGELVLN